MEKGGAAALAESLENIYIPASAIIHPAQRKISIYQVQFFPNMHQSVITHSSKKKIIKKMFLNFLVAFSVLRSAIIFWVEILIDSVLARPSLPQWR